MNDFDDIDRDLIQQGATLLGEALMQGKVTLDKVRCAQATDVQTVSVREYWGDKNDEQRLVTKGIKLRIAVRNLILSQEAQQ